jgi:ketosteroid isomerase-like protein
MQSKFEKMKLPSLITEFVNASNNRDSNAVIACFAENAIVHDEGQEMRGLSAIKEWSDKGFEKYQYVIEPIGIADTGERAVLTSTVSGSFPGSPVSLDFNFVIHQDRIVALNIQ